MIPALAAALLLGVAVALALPRSLRATGGRHQPQRAAAVGEQPHLLLRLRPVLVPLTALAGWAFIGGPIGLVVGLAAAAFAWRTLASVESPAARRRRERLAADLPTAVDLLGSCLSAGAAPEVAVVTVAEAMEGPVADELWLIHHRLSLGLDPHQVWADLARHPQLGPLGRTIARTQETGSSITEAIRALARELRARGRAEVEDRARRVEVKASAPVGVCFLPAFVLLGVVPLIAGLFGALNFLD